MQIIKEVCVDTFIDAINAEKNGADRIELCGRLDLDGLTPSRRLIKKVFLNLSIPIRVMIRPKHPSFVYSEKDIKKMILDINYCKDLGIDGVVLGCLNNDFSLNIRQIKILSDVAKPLKVIVHKAIDKTESVLSSLLLLLDNKDINGILSSGGNRFASDSTEILKKMVDLVPNDFEIISAGGITFENISDLHHKIGGKYYHGKKIIKLN
tara:strand:- start:1023 stop:1649 length:627 start_codon:yes stop_codon:yes gene_type:complete